MTEIFEAELLVDAGADLGEGPCWDHEAGRLLWVDVDGRRAHRTSPEGADEVVVFDRIVSVVVPLAADPERWVVATQEGLGTCDPATGAVTVTHHLNPADVRMNDGKCDPAGRLFAGSMAFDARRGAGALHRLDPDGRLTTLVEAVTISNGLGWSPDGQRMYFIDSLDCGVDWFDYDPDTGGVGDRHRAFDVGALDEPGGMQVPDGMTMDAEGCLWVSVFGAGAVRRFSPEGELLAQVRVPVPHTTSCCFGGEDLGTLFVTTAAKRLDAAGRRQYPSAGGLFAVRPGVTGTASSPFAGDPATWA